MILTEIYLLKKKKETNMSTEQTTSHIQAVVQPDKPKKFKIKKTSNQETEEPPKSTKKKKKKTSNQESGELKEPPKSTKKKKKKTSNQESEEPPKSTKKKSLNIDKNNEEWLHIIKENKIDLNKNLSLITAKNIKNSKINWNGKASQFEPRLLCKIDSSNSRPKIFKDNNIYMISVKNGTYALIKQNIYIPLKYEDIPVNIIKNKSDCLLLSIGESETSMLDKLYYNNVLSNIIGEKIVYGPLLGGRHYCSFKTNIGSHFIEIQGSQYETDGCYETENYVCIVEAKSCKLHDFNIRQLYFPFREVYDKIQNKKKIICLFICKDKDNIIHIFKYKWNDYMNMMDIINIGYYKFKIECN